MADPASGNRGDPLTRAGDLIAPRWIPELFLAFAAVLVPWIGYLSISLPQRTINGHYNLSWVGFDLFLLFAIARTGYMAFRGRRQAELPAVATATLLIVDAWFDVTTAQPGGPFVEALLEAVFVELPTAALAIYISRRVERLRAARVSDDQ